MNREDRELVGAIRAGDTSAFLELYQRYANGLFHFLWNRTPDRETAEDLVQDTFVKLWKKRGDLDPDGHFRALLFRTARNLAIDFLRRKQRQGLAQELDEDQPAAAADPEAFVKRDRIREALNELSKNQRAVFCLSRFEGLKYPEIAEVLEISVKTVEAHMGRALKKLRDRLHDLARYLFFTPFL